MGKSEILKSLEDAKKLHQEQMLKIEKAIEGKEVENPPELGKMECGCGSWFYSNKEYMISILGLQLFERLDKMHEMWHMEYSKIYNILFAQKKKGLFSKLLGNKIDPLEMDKVKLYYKDLGDITDELLHVADAAIRRVGALSESKF